MRWDEGMAVHVTRHRGGFDFGRTSITALEGEEDPTGIALSVFKLRPGERSLIPIPRETAFLLMAGHAVFDVSGQRHALSRASLFEDLPSAVHVARGAEVEIEARSEVELTVYETANLAPFSPLVRRPSDVRDELRGRGLVRDAALRFVRTILDRDVTDPAAELVLGEVVNLPGRWSSYPPHHHPHPELYHYRFTAPEGFGHAELGETVLKVRSFDTVKILGGRDHPQCAAPGYGMYYAWVIRHLEGDPYIAPEFTDAHRWILSGGAGYWPSRLDAEGEPIR